jgi:hypothetical protein
LGFLASTVRQKLTAEVQPTGYSRLFILLETNRTVTFH